MRKLPVCAGDKTMERHNRTTKSVRKIACTLLIAKESGTGHAASEEYGAIGWVVVLLFCLLLHFIVPFGKLRAALPGLSYSSGKTIATQSYKCMLGRSVFP